MDIDEIKTITDIIANVITTIGILLAGLWSYFNFVVGRSLAAHVELKFAQTQVISETNEFSLAVIRVTAKNLGKTKAIKMRSFILIDQIRTEDASNNRFPARIDKPLNFESLKVHNIFDDHAYLEPGEVIFDGLVVRVENDFLYKVKMLWKDKKVDSSSYGIINPRLNSYEAE